MLSSYYNEIANIFWLHMKAHAIGVSVYALDSYADVQAMYLMGACL